MVKIEHESVAMVKAIKIKYVNHDNLKSSEIILTPDHYVYLREYSHPIQAKLV